MAFMRLPCAFPACPPGRPHRPYIMRSSFITRAESSSWKPNNSTSLQTGSSTSVSGPPSCGGIFDYDQKADQLKAVERELEDPKVWDNAERAQELGRQKRSLENVVLTLNRVGDAKLDCP